MKIIKIFSLIIAVIFSFTACNEYLDVVPDDVATIDHAFEDHTQARKYLNTCYSFLPAKSNMWSNPALLGSDEFWIPEAQYNQSFTGTPQAIVRGLQTSVSPIANLWESGLFIGIRQCNVFMEKIDLVPNMDDSEKVRMKAEVRVLKSYYHYLLLRQYGPIPIIASNIEVGAEPEDIKFERQPVAKVFDYVTAEIDSSISYLPSQIQNRSEELGRITKSVALGMKARIHLLQASPLFNGNDDYSDFVDNNGNAYFPAYDKEKWKLAMESCEAAINEAHNANHGLFEYSSLATNYNDTVLTLATLRRRVTERWNDEVVWGDSKNAGFTHNLQRWSQANLGDRVAAVVSGLGVTFNIVQEYYTANGLPTSEDKTWDASQEMVYKEIEDTDRYYLEPKESIPGLHFGREPRFYADLGFDRSAWHWQGVTNVEAPNYIKCRAGEKSGKNTIWEYNVTGYFPKKVCHPDGTFNSAGNYSTTTYAFPRIRLADLYLGYAEAINEYEGPGTKAYEYLDYVRQRAGIPGVIDSYTNYSNNPSKPTTQDGLREIIHQERLNELSFETRRYWDLRRWKKAESYLSKKAYGWNAEVTPKDDYYTLRVVGERNYTRRDYLWPIRDYVLTVNTNLIQNPGWE